MLATRTVRAARRTFSSVAESGGFKVASLEQGQPTSAVTVLVNAGSRFESKPGVAHALKNFAFKSTSARSALGTVRESELYGGVLTATLTREHLALTAEFLRGEEEFFVDLLTSYITQAQFARHELEELVSPVVQDESTMAASDPATSAIELAHAIAFRSGLGASLFASPHSPVTAEDVASFAKQAFTPANVAFLGTGIEQAKLASLVQKSLDTVKANAKKTKVVLPATPAPSSSPSKYFGGESRVAGHGPQTVFIGFGTTGAPSPSLAALAAHLSPAPSTKWGSSLSPIVSTPNAKVEVVVFPYSDASLFGILVQGSTTDAVRTAAKSAVESLQAAAKGVKAEDVTKAVAKAKFATASTVDGRDGVVSVLGAKVLAGSEASLKNSLSSFDSVDAKTFASAAASLVKVKPTFVAIGDIQSLPYIDELGL